MPAIRLPHRLAALVGVPLALLLAASLVVGWQLLRIAGANEALEQGRVQRD
ncbi:MAG: hypothetical protein HXY24_15490, partial [Rubrivivax sp.]|nr:hypothetical protein [Rubrivivax sp.]